MDEDDAPVDGLVVVGSRPIGAAVACRMVRRLGCTWPIEVWLSGDGPDLKLAADVTVIPGCGSLIEAIRGTRFDRVVVIDDNTYPVAMPCRLFDEAGDASFVYWDGPDADGPLVIDRRAAASLLEHGPPWSTALLSDPCSHACVGPRRRTGSVEIFAVAGAPRLVRRKYNLFRYWDGIGDARLPMEDVVSEVLREVLGELPSCDPAPGNR